MFKKAAAVVLSLTIAVSMAVAGTTMATAEASTGVGLAAHALLAYREGWRYVWGASSYGTVDCSGLIYSYNGVGGIRTDMLASSSTWGYVSNGVPRIHGLGLHQPGHIGVYIGSGMAVDARDENSGVVYHNVYNKSWVEWFKVAGVLYPQNGWVLLDGDSFYYEDGQYIIDTTRTFDGVTYSFDSAGVSNLAPPYSAYEATDYSTVTAEQAQPVYVAPVVEESSEEEYYYEESYYEESSEEEIYYYEEESSEPEESIEESSEEESSEPEESIEESSEEESSEEPEESSEESVEEESIEEESSEEESVAEESIDEESAEESSDEETNEESNEEISSETSEESGDETSEETSDETSNETSEESAEESSEESIVEESSEPESEIVYIAAYGDKDTEENKTVSSVQTRLYELGYLSETADGWFGDETVNAVMAFQSLNDLEVTGKVDAATHEALNSGNAVSNFSTLEKGAFDDENSIRISSLQHRLKELKYFYEEATGFYGKLTKNAVEQFQKDNDLEVTGVADAATQKALFDDDAKVNPYAGSVSYGQSGAMVLKMQKRLLELRYLSGIVSEDFDDNVLKAVHEYQKAAGLEISDRVTAEQLEELYSDNAPKSPAYDTLKYGFSGDDVAKLQSRLAALKYYDGKTSGVYSQSVVAAVEKFQEDMEVDVTGEADEDVQELIKTEAQRQSAKVGEQLILQTATIADNALAGLADSKSTEISITKQNTDDIVKTGAVLGIVAVFTALMSAIFVLELKRKKKLESEEETDISGKYGRKF